MSSDTNSPCQLNGLSQDLSEAQLLDLAAAFSAILVPGDCVVLRGELGAGKTTFARAVVRAILNDPLHEVPSPTFALRQDYSSARCDIVHFDLYRLSDPRELDELGFNEALDRCITLVEWPERATSSMPQDRFELQLRTASRPDARHVTLVGHVHAAARATLFGDTWRHQQS
jgi:N-acetylmuramate 1-kinase